MRLLFLLGLTGCFHRPLIDKIYTVDHPGYGWKKLPRSGGADRAWQHHASQSVIYVDANCDQKFSDQNLKDAIVSLTHGITEKKVEFRKYLSVAQRKAILQVQNGELDGIPLKLALLVVSKNRCLFDFMYIAPPKQFIVGLPNFLRTAQSLDTSIDKRYLPLENSK